MLSTLAAAAPRQDPPLSLFPVVTVWSLALNNRLTVAPAYDAELDRYECPQGELLTLHTFDDRNKLTIYKAPASSCNACRSLRTNARTSTTRSVAVGTSLDVDMIVGDENLVHHFSKLSESRNLPLHWH